ncbi:flap endonuclease-1 [Sulfodiicoccus acidiphilus]|uniref:Flap endonuclease 1 n=1 Tax=Sulfodiicoccus acidiphilus TaxID=1670455 RepID=A0A348B2W4_9CREN|nr:flap endonuclease-1 [Sulfodiicoccus acidiphilus]GGT93979.1 flap endonuclease-1 [Sulfodiicoccus acidiphilus]
MKGKKISIDAYNAIYQFLAAIRQPDGTPLVDSKGRVTSHLSGLFYRTVNLLEEGVTPIYVFDGKPPEMKRGELERRRQVKEEAKLKYEKAKERGDVQSQRKYAAASAYLTDEMVRQSKELLKAMGVPHVQAPAEGEAEAAHIHIQGKSWAVGSQDYDSLLFGAERLIRNLTVTGRRKLPNKEVYVEIKPEILELSNMLRELGITREQLIDVALLVGTDYDPEGVRGFGPKRAYSLVKKYGSLEAAARAGELDLSDLGVDLRELRDAFLNPRVEDVEGELNLGEVDRESVLRLLVEEHDFNEERVASALSRMERAMSELKGSSKQSGLDKWF